MARTKGSKNRNKSVTKDSRLTMRIQSGERGIVERAAKRDKKSVSRFVWDAAYQAACVAEGAATDSTD